MDQDFEAALQTAFREYSAFYKGRGFMRRLGFGSRPAIVNVDLAKAWTEKGSAFACDGMETIIPATQKLNEAGRALGIPIVFTTCAYDIVEGPLADTGLWGRKIPLEHLKAGSPLCEIDDRLERRADERLIVKKRASAFEGTDLAGYLTSLGIDTVILTGVTLSSCVRISCEDALWAGFRPIVVRECVGDRIAGAVEWNLFDIDAKFGDVEPLETVLAYLDGLAGPNV
ncbi:isochorismatase family protein [Kaistia dalseonensis]|uniref:N-carbamoylsarcosine amidase n=1 Tax=Kaistia dalseonensis TaxID=410840 RepID=A0ABU0H8W2_9HYPH|nr:isochorismatase family protein [Kaistia dalseonensis]MCX5496127.1 isochorismatase family protein [Kaistia dalseonensis]MDQ0438736.1 N-carbamoylsarcosine amidase [Kaistia dalseonensis]